MIQRTGPDDLGYVERLLSTNQLPTDDIHANDVELYVGRDDSIRVGVGGFEAYGPHGLLRSVVIEEEQRDQEYGAELTQRLLGEARHQGIDEMYLLTTTARDFFDDLGFQVTDREQVPAVIRATNEFAELCPDSAVCMQRRLD